MVCKHFNKDKDTLEEICLINKKIIFCCANIKKCQFVELRDEEKITFIKKKKEII